MYVIAQTMKCIAQYSRTHGSKFACLYKYIYKHRTTGIQYVHVASYLKYYCTFHYCATTLLERKKYNYYTINTSIVHCGPSERPFMLFGHGLVEHKQVQNKKIKFGVM